MLLISVGAIGVEAIRRLVAPEPLVWLPVALIAAAGILVNGVTAWLFARGREHDLNLRAAFLHMAGDAGLSAGVLVAAVCHRRDRLAAARSGGEPGIAAVITWTTWGLLRKSIDLAMDAVPDGVSREAVHDYLAGLPGVIEVHDLHIWGLSTTETALTAHLVCDATGRSGAAARCLGGAGGALPNWPCHRADGDRYAGGAMPFAVARRGVGFRRRGGVAVARLKGASYDRTPPEEGGKLMQEASMSISRRAVVRGGLATGMLAPGLTTIRRAAAAPSDAATLRAVMQGDLRVFDPIWTTANITAYYGAMVYDTLFAIDEQFQPQPQMVDKYSLVDDKLTYTFELRDGLGWQDDTPVTAADCVASMRRWAVRNGGGQVMQSFLKDISAKDDKTFVIALKEPFGLVLDLLASRNHAASAS